MNIYLTLFWEFFKTGLFAVGGGLAAIPFLVDMANKNDWLTLEQLTDMVAVAESTPGPIGINAATYAGFNAAGVPGSLIASFSIALAPFILVSFIARAFERYNSSLLVKNLFAGLRPAVTGLIAAAGWAMLRLALLNDASGLFGLISPKALILFVVILLLTNLNIKIPFKKKAVAVKSLHPICFLGLAAAVGIIFNF